jgi:hypothetical protein
MPVETALDRSLADASGYEKPTPQAKAQLQKQRLGVESPEFGSEQSLDPSNGRLDDRRSQRPV